MTRLAITSGRYVRSLGLALLLAGLIASAGALTETAEAAPRDFMGAREAECILLGGIYYEVNMRDYGCWYMDRTWNCSIGWNIGGWFESCIIVIHEPDGPVYHAP